MFETLSAYPLSHSPHLLFLLCFRSFAEDIDLPLDRLAIGFKKVTLDCGALQVVSSFLPNGFVSFFHTPLVAIPSSNLIVRTLSTKRILLDLPIVE